MQIKKPWMTTDSRGVF